MFARSRRSRPLHRLFWSLILAAPLSACDGGGSSGSPDTTDPAPAGLFRVHLELSGLVAGSSVSVSLNSGNERTLSANGTFPLNPALAAGDDFHLEIANSSIEVQCSIVSGTGTVSDRDVTVAATCVAAPAFTLSGTLSGLDPEDSVTLIVADQSLALNADGAFTFEQALYSSQTYQVTVAGEPALQRCAVANGSGTVRDRDITGVTVDCSSRVAEFHLVHDVNGDYVENSADARGFTPFGLNGFLFSAETAESGREAWYSDGTPEGTWMLTDIRPGPKSSYPTDFAVVGALAVFQATGDTGQRRLWVTDGTLSGTRELLALELSSYTRLYPMAGGVVFAAYHPDTGFEPWITDGTEAGTRLVADVRPGTGSSYLGQEGASTGALFYFTAPDADAGPPELWVTDGSAAGTRQVADLNDDTGYVPSALTAFGDRVVWRSGSTRLGVESALWHSDGTEPGTGVLLDAVAGSAEDSYACLTVIGSELYLQAWDADHGSEVWVSDGTPGGTERVDVYPGEPSSQPCWFTATSAGVYFEAESADQPGQTDLYLLPAGGGAAQRVETQIERNFGGYPSIMGVGDRLLFVKSTPAEGRELWAADGSTAAAFMALNPGPGDGVYAWFEFAGLVGTTLYFAGNDGTSGFEIWRTAGDPGSTVPYVELNPELVTGDGFGQVLGATDAGVLFVGCDAEAGCEPWFTDGTSPGTYRVADIQPGAGDSSGSQAGSLGDRLVFDAHPVGADQAWVSDGTPGGTFALHDVWLDQPAAIGHKVLFRGFQPETGWEPWLSDGTPSGTRLLADLREGPGSSFAEGFTALGADVYFAAQDPGRGLWRWRPDADQVEAVATVDIEFPSPGSMVAWHSNLLFFARTDSAGVEPWISDGSASGTRPLRDIAPGEVSSNPRYWATLDPVALFSAAGPDNGHELWATDGTSGGTVELKDIVPGPGSSSPSALTVVGDRVYFTARNADGGRTVWVSDGTAAGTRQLTPGDSPTGAPDRFAGFDGLVYFAAEDDASILRLWVTDGTPGRVRLVDPDLEVHELTPPFAVPDGPHAGIYLSGKRGDTGFELYRGR